MHSYCIFAFPFAVGRRASDVRIIIFLVCESCDSDPKRKPSENIEYFRNVGQRGALIASRLQVPYRLLAVALDHAPTTAATHSQSARQGSATEKFVLGRFLKLSLTIWLDSRLYS